MPLQGQNEADRIQPIPEEYEMEGFHHHHFPIDDESEGSYESDGNEGNGGNDGDDGDDGDDGNDEGEESEESEESDFEVPSLDDIIPWSGPGRRPRQPEVLDPVRTAGGINRVFLENVLRSYYAMKGLIQDVKIESHTEKAMDTLEASQRNDVTEVNVVAIVNGQREIYHFVIKTLTTSQPVRALCAAHQFDKREACLYLEILEDINLFQRQQVEDPGVYTVVPSSKCFFARYKEPERGNDSGEDYSIPPDESVVVLENVKYRGYAHTLIDQGLSVQQVLTVFEGISRLHGLSLAMKERSGIPLHYSYNYLICIAEASHCLVALYQKNMPQLKKLFKTYGALGVFNRATNFGPQLVEKVFRLARPVEPMAVLAHMNLWAHNILFKGEDDCVIIDWQMITRARPTFDLAFLLATSVDTAVRRENLKIFLDHYYRHIANYSLTFGLDLISDCHFTREDLFQDYRRSQLLAMFFFVGKKNDLLKSPATQARFIDYMNEIDSQGLLLSETAFIPIPECVPWEPPARVEPKEICPIDVEEESSDDEENDQISSIFPVNELPKD